MHSLMFPQRSSISERFVTEATRVGSLTGVNTLMNLLRTSRVEHLITVMAGKQSPPVRLYHIMSRLVCCKTALVRIFLPAVFTHVGETGAGCGQARVVCEERRAGRRRLLGFSARVKRC
uniref:Uncharacterized protein n=1 Tax=Cacopsylla melanoneura TaxID=428564 RepID=A0A8D9F9Y8_9HEMI